MISRPDHVVIYSTGGVSVSPDRSESAKASNMGACMDAATKFLALCKSAGFEARYSLDPHWQDGDPPEGLPLRVVDNNPVAADKTPVRVHKASRRNPRRPLPTLSR